MSDIYSAEKRHQIMARVGRRETLPELAVRKLLDEIGIGYETNCDDLPGRPDIVLRDCHASLFVHGCFWHGHECTKGKSAPKTNVLFWRAKLARNVIRDKENVGRLQSLGWKVDVIWECETKNREELADKLRQIIGQ